MEYMNTKKLKRFTKASFESKLQFRWLIKIRKYPSLLRGNLWRKIQRYSIRWIENEQIYNIANLFLYKLK